MSEKVFPTLRGAARTSLAAAVLLLGSAPYCVPSGTAATAIAAQAETATPSLAEEWGVQVVALRSTAAGHMVDFRYRVLDAVKAAPLFKRQTKPYLIHEDSGKVLAVPNTAKIGALRNSNQPRQGKIYWMFFGNHHGVVRKGDKVTVAIGDFRAKDLTVE